MLHEDSCIVTPSLWQPSDVTLTQALHGKGSACCGNCDSTSHSIISRCGLEIFVYI